MTVIRVIEDSILKNKDLFLTYYDFVKAYDSLSINALECFLFHMKFGPLTKVIIDLLSDQETNIETWFGKVPIQIDGGVRQGDVISPTLFILYLAPLLWTIQQETEGYEIEGIKFLLVHMQMI